MKGGSRSSPAVGPGSERPDGLTLLRLVDLAQGPGSHANPVIGETHVGNGYGFRHVTTDASACRLDRASPCRRAIVAARAALVVKAVGAAARVLVGVMAGGTGDGPVAFLEARAQLQADGLETGHD